VFSNNIAVQKSKINQNYYLCADFVMGDKLIASMRKKWHFNKRYFSTSGSFTVCSGEDQNKMKENLPVTFSNQLILDEKERQRLEQNTKYCSEPQNTFTGT